MAARRRVAAVVTAPATLVLSLVVAVLLAAGHTAVAPTAVAESVISVHPTGSYPADVRAVQAAVDRGGTVVLRAVAVDGRPTAFDFGPADTDGRQRLADVVLEKDVTIVGDEGTTPTRIVGGVIPFFGVARTQTRIERLVFEGPLLSAMIFIRSSGAEIADNHITGVVGLPLSFGWTEGRGVKFLGNSDPADAITGQVRILGNRFDDMQADLSEAIVFDSVAADVTIADNHVDDVASGGVLAIVPEGDVAVTGNTIRSGPGDGDGPPFGNGVLLLGSAGGAYRVTGNTIICENPMADTVLLAGTAVLGLGAVNGPVVSHNVLENARAVEFGVVSLLGDINHGRVANNRIRGASLYALGLWPLFGEETATGNRFVGNNLTHFQEVLADTVVSSHAHETHVIGNAGTVFDLGHSTAITGERPVEGSFSRRQHDAAAVDVVLKSRSGSAGP